MRTRWRRRIRRAPPPAQGHGCDAVRVRPAGTRREELRPLPLVERKAKLARLLARKPLAIVLNEHTDEDGATVFRHACKLGFEGIASKRLIAATGLDRPGTGSRSRTRTARRCGGCEAEARKSKQRRGAAVHSGPLAPATAPHHDSPAAGTGTRSMGRKPPTPEQRELKRAASKLWHEEHREERLADSKRWRAKHRKHRRAYHKEWREEHREQHNAANKRWYAKNRERINEARRQRNRAGRDAKPEAAE